MVASEAEVGNKNVENLLNFSFVCTEHWSQHTSYVWVAVKPGLLSVELYCCA